MANEQIKLPITAAASEPAPFDAGAVAKHIGSHAPSNPYSSQERRAAQIAERYAATYTPDTLPAHLKDVAAAAEAHFAETAPGKHAVAAEVEVEAPIRDVSEPAETYFDPIEGEEHVIDQELTKQQNAILKARAEARAVAGVTTERQIDTAARGHGKTLGHLINKGMYPNN